MAKGRSRSKWRVLDGRTNGRLAEACSAEPIDAQPHRAWMRCSRAMGECEIHMVKPAKGRGYFGLQDSKAASRLRGDAGKVTSARARGLPAAGLLDLLAHLLVHGRARASPRGFRAQALDGPQPV